MSKNVEIESENNQSRLTWIFRPKTSSVKVKPFYEKTTSIKTYQKVPKNMLKIWENDYFPEMNKWVESPQVQIFGGENFFDFDLVGDGPGIIFSRGTCVKTS